MAQERVKEVRAGRGPHGPRPKVKNPGKILKRIMGYVLHVYRVPYIIAVACIVISVVANIQGTLFMQTLIDSYILDVYKRQELYDGMNQLRSAKTTIDESWDLLADKQIELDDAKKEIEEARATLADAAAELEDARQTIAEKTQELDVYKRQHVRRWPHW